MSKICYSNDEERWSKARISCLDDYKGYTYLGHYVLKSTFENNKETIMFVLNDFTDHGFKFSYQEEDKYLYVYAYKKDYKHFDSVFDCAAWMSAVSVTRYLTSNSSRKFFYIYKKIREQGFSLTETIHLTMTFGFGVIPIANSGLYQTREKPDLNKKNRQGIDGVFYCKSSTRNNSLSKRNTISGAYRNIKTAMPNLTHLSPDKISSMSDESFKKLKEKYKIYVELCQ